MEKTVRYSSEHADNYNNKLEFRPDRFDEVIVPPKNFSDTVREVTEDTRTRRNPFLLRGERNTTAVVERLFGQEGYEQSRADDVGAPYGRWHGKHVIGSGTQIDGGVYMGRAAREALIVDAHSPAMQKLYNQIQEHCLDIFLDLWARKHPGGTLSARVIHDAFQEHVPRFVYETVCAALPYDEEVERSIRAHYEINKQPDAEVSVDVYLMAGGGVCRHQAVVVGALLERLINEGRLRGRVSLERRYVAGVIHHAWVEFTDRDEVTWIIDPAQRIFAEKNKLPGIADFVYGLIPNDAEALTE